MTEDSSGPAHGIAVGVGLVLWIATAVIGGRTEPWDTSLYWIGTYPAAIVIAGLLGYQFPQRPWRWAVVLIFMQVPVMVAAGAGLGMLPIGLVLLAVLSLPAVLTAWVSAKLRRRAELV